MSEDSDAEKKHDPSERQLEQAALEGRLPRTHEIGAIAGLFALAATVRFGWQQMLQPIDELARAIWTDGSTELDLGGSLALGAMAAKAGLVAVALPLGAVAVAGVFAGLAQTQGALATDSVKVDFERLDVFAGLQRLVEPKHVVVELGRGIVRILVVGGALVWASSDWSDDVVRLAADDARGAIPALVEMGWDVFVRAIPLAILVALADYAATWWQAWQDLKRTDQQVRDENKDVEGDPHTKAARKRLARQMAMNPALLRVKEATVVVTNPTHYAIALRYHPKRDRAPVVVARGVDHLAAQIRAEADRHRIPRVEDRPLARALYARVRVGRAIPADLFGPVARVLATVMRRRAATTKSNQGLPLGSTGSKS